MKEFDWEDVRIFRELAKSRTLRSAAISLGMHHSTISRRLESLEQTVGARLFDRSPDGYILTQSGELLFESASKAAELLANAEVKIRGQDATLSGTVRVTMPGILAEIVFAPNMSEFTEQYPSLEIELDTGVALADMSRREADVAIRLDNNPDEDLVGKRLMTYCHTAYAHPVYIETTTPSRTPERARWINFSEDRARHPAWAADSEFPNVPSFGFFPDVRLQTALARSQLGLALLPCIIGDNTPDLVRVGKTPPTPSRDIWLLTHNDLRRSARIRAFMNFAERILMQQKPLITGEAPRGAQMSHIGA